MKREVEITVEIIAQATRGISRFLHPDYSSSVPYPPPDYVIVPDIHPSITENFNPSEILLQVYSIVVVVIIVILIANSITNLIKKKIR